MLTAIIPALNEELTIGKVVQFCINQPLISEVIVIDDKSEDNTVSIATEAGAKVIISEVRGKGTSMKDGVNAATNELLIFLDADINYPEDTVTLLSKPLLVDETDFVKGTFSRNAGRVTELVAKPLLNIFYPGLAEFSQPLSGMIAGKKSFFKRIKFFNDYGVDVGILIDMYLMKARIQEVNIGYIENRSKPWEALGKMSKEVAKAIITKAQQQSPEDVTEEKVKSIEEINRQMNYALQENLSGFHKMAVFDMDNTILKGRFIDECAKKFGFTAQLEDLRETETDSIILTKRIGLLLKGKSIDELLNVVHKMEMIEDIKEVVSTLKKKGYIVGIISNSYTLITNYVIRNIGADFSYANQLEFFEGKVTGEVGMPFYFFGSPESICGHSYCKTNAMQYACEKYNVYFRNCIAIGDSKDDRCMVGHAGQGFAFCTTDELLKKMAKKHINEQSFQSLLTHV
jgi:glucosyl-3-phosphoglycerate synthase